MLEAGTNPLSPLAIDPGIGAESIYDDRVRKILCHIENRHVLQLSYQFSYDRVTHPMIHPYLLVFVFEKWYLFGWRGSVDPDGDFDRGIVCAPLDRITDMRVVDRPYRFVSEEEMNRLKKKYYDGSISGGKPIRIVLRFDLNTGDKNHDHSSLACFLELRARPLCQNTFFSDDQAIKNDGYAIVTMETTVNWRLRQGLKRYLAYAKILEPESLRKDYLDWLSGIVKRQSALPGDLGF